MSAEVVIDANQVSAIAQRMLSFSGKLNNSEIVESVALQVKDNIFLRTNAGQDVSMLSFAPYSQKYAEMEGKTIVNLMKTGQMLNEMTQKAMSNDTAKIFFMTERSRKLADVHNNLGAGRSKVIREFFGINEKDFALAKDLYQQAIKKAKEEVSI